MNTLSNEEFAKEIMKLANETPSHGPIAYYDQDGDCIEFLSTPGNFYAERIDDLITVYYDEKTDEIIGSLVKDVSQFIKKNPRFAILVESGRVRLAHLFIAGLGSQTQEPNDIVIQTYKKLLEQAEETSVEAGFAVIN